MTPIILASGSASRRAVLNQAGLDVTAIPPHVDETSAKMAFRAENMPIRDQAMALAELKAQRVSIQHSGLVVGGDQMLALGETAFDKPTDLQGAADHLRALSGRTHTLETALVVYENGQSVWRHLARPKLTMRTLTPEFIETYIAICGEALLDTVGAYQLEGRGSQLFTRIEGDYFSILGLPLLPLLAYLRDRGVIEK